MNEIGWLARNGLVSSYADYLNLPLAVLEDCRMVMAAEIMRRKVEDARR